jgi:hypothetical protein
MDRNAIGSSAPKAACGNLDAIDPNEKARHLDRASLLFAAGAADSPPWPSRHTRK